MEGDLTNLKDEQVKALAKNFVQTFGNDKMSDSDVFYAGLGVFFATMTETAYTPEQQACAFKRLKKIAA